MARPLVAAQHLGLPDPESPPRLIDQRRASADAVKAGNASPQERLDDLV